MNTEALRRMTRCSLSIAALACAITEACASSSTDAPASGVAGASVGSSGASAGVGPGAGGGPSASAGTVNDGGGGALPSAGGGGNDGLVAGASGSVSAAAGNDSTGAAGAAGTKDGGSAGMAGQVAQGGAASAAVCPNGAVFCDDFESLAAMAPPSGSWVARTNGNATVLVDTEHAYSGTKAVHFHSASVDNNQRAYMLTQNLPEFPVVSDTLYVRFMLYIGRYISNGSSVHNRIAWVGSRALLASGGGDGDGYVFATYNGVTIERLQTNHGFQRDTSQHLDDASLAGKWLCFEFEIDNKGGVPAGESSNSTALPHIWQDGVELKLSAAGSATTWSATPFEALQLSLWCPQTDPKGTDYWIDDVAVSKQRINCPKP